MEPVAMSESQPNDRVPDVAEFDNAIQSHMDRMAALSYADLTTWIPCTIDRWPPSAETTLADGPAYSYSLRLSGFSDGQLAVTLYRDDGTPPLHTEFHRVALSENSTFLIHLSIRDERVTLKVGSTELGPYCPDQQPLKIQGSPRRG
jgi:hypothetical protein